MKQFLTVLSFELGNYFKKKSFVITTIIIAAVIAIVLSIPSFVDCSKIIPGLTPKDNEPITNTDSENDKTNYALLDTNNIIPDKSILEVTFPDSNWTFVNNIKEAETLINEDTVVSAFEVKSLTEYSHLVKNTNMTDTTHLQFESVLKELYHQKTITDAGYNYEVINEIYNTEIKSDTTILGKDSAGNFFYAYILIFIIYMMILMYGQLIAMSVTAEKSNRAIEVLVTSTSSNSLIFGKVIAGALASIAQIATVLASGTIFYKLNGAVWNGLLDSIFAIPSELLITFTLFGTVGYLLYALIFGALGALVSKTEDIGSSVTPIMLIFMATFFLSIFGLNKSDLLLIKITSFIPFCSPMLMIVRVAMGSVTFIEVAISFVILLATVMVTGLGAAKIYRNATLMYGNPIKLKNALKWFKK